jgi:arylsulfatase A-like enzyme
MLWQQVLRNTNIDRLASQGIRFTNAYACVQSLHDRAALMTGKYPVSTGITDWIPGRQATMNGLPEDRLLALRSGFSLRERSSLLQKLSKATGIATMISGKWHLGAGEEFWPENRVLILTAEDMLPDSQTGVRHPTDYFFLMVILAQ